MIKIVEKIQTIEHEEVLQNTTELENLWYFRDKVDFEKHLKEFYEPDTWFTGKKRVFEIYIANKIKQAKDSIVLCSFLLETTKVTDALLEAVENNVRVYILTASENQLDKIYNLENELDDERVVEHKNLLKLLRKKCLIRTAPHFHAKYVLIDPKLETRLGFLSSANFTQHAFSNNVEIGQLLDQDQICDLFNLFCYNFWYESEHEYLVEKTLRSVKQPPKDFFNNPKLSCLFSPRMNLDFEEILMETIQSSKGDIYLSTYSIDSKNSIYTLLLEELNKNRRVIIYIRPRKNDLEPLNKLRNAGAKIYGHPLLHFKCLLVDNDKDTRGLIFTGNITEESFTKSYDVGIFLKSSQYQKILEIIREWENVMPSVFIGNESINSLPVGRYLTWNPNKNEFEIQPSETYDLGSFKGDDIYTYDNYKPNLEIPEKFKKTTKEIIFKWQNSPPILPNKSKLIKELPEDMPKKTKDLSKKFNIYQKGKQFYLLYKEGDNLKDLKKLSELTKFKIVVK